MNKLTLRKRHVIRNAALSVIVAYLQSAARIILPWAEERVDGLFKAGVKHVQSLHRDGVVETKPPVVIVQVHTNTRRVPVIGDRDAAVFSIGIQPVLQTQTPVSCRGGETDKTLPVAAFSGDAEVPHTLVLHVHLPVMLATGVLRSGKDAAEPREAGWQVWLLVTNTALLHFGVKVRDKQVWVSGVRV